MTVDADIHMMPLYVPMPLQNYIWLIINQKTKEAIVIDPGFADPVLAYLQQHQLSLISIWVTHDHHDHVAGVASLKQAYPTALIYAHQAHQLPKGIPADIHVHPHTNDGQQESHAQNINAWQYPVAVWSLEGHKQFHVGYLLKAEKIHVFCGDILFSAGCGRVFSGTVAQLYDSLQRLATLPEDTLFYPTHEFTQKNLAFALSLLPNDVALKQASQQVNTLRQADKPTLPTTLANEKSINLFLRVHEKAVYQAVSNEINQTMSQTNDTRSLAVFTALRKLKDNF